MSDRPLTTSGARRHQAASFEAYTAAYTSGRNAKRTLFGALMGAITVVVELGWIMLLMYGFASLLRAVGL
jgi:hypothetical protein